MVEEQVDLLCQDLRRHHQANTVVELHTVLLACTTDSVSRFTFGKTAGLQGNNEKMNMWRQTMIAIPKITPLVKQFPWVTNIARRLPLSLLFRIIPDLARLLQLHKVRQLCSKILIHNRLTIGSLSRRCTLKLESFSTP